VFQAHRRMPMKRVLMIAYHFPPLAESSGVQRTLSFVRHLPALGWQPLVLSAHCRAYGRVDPRSMQQVPDGTVVRRAFALDTSRHLAIAGRYLRAWASPDRWISWKYAAVREGLRLINQFAPDALWSTYPIPTAHLIGAELQRRSGLPWVADFRDPMAHEGYPTDAYTWQQYERVEQETFRHASHAVFTTEGAAALYRARYPAHASRMAVIENGYDEDAFEAAEAAVPVREPLNAGALTLLHSGIVYPVERDPRPLIEALRQLRSSGRIAPGSLKLRFRGAVHEDLLNTLASEAGVAECVEVLEPLPYAQALEEMLRADGLMLLQGADCNAQIPAKAYEYLRAGRPILCLADPAGDTAALLRSAGIAASANLGDSGAIAACLDRFLQGLRRGEAPAGNRCAVAHASRAGRGAALAGLLDGLTARAVAA
jgi:glycosyltransferase involved in cell wall biosynthesis